MTLLLRAVNNRVTAAILMAALLQTPTFAASNTAEHAANAVQNYLRPIPKSFGDRHIVLCAKGGFDAAALTDCISKSGSQCDVSNAQDADYCSTEMSDFLDAYLGFLISHNAVPSRFTASTYRKWSSRLSKKCDKMAETVDTHGVEHARCEIDARMTVIHKYAPAGAVYEPCRLSQSCR